jgi:hypothetical protein
VQGEESKKAWEFIAPCSFKSWSIDGTDTGDIIEILD